MDKQNSLIIRELLKNSRASVREIAKEIKMRPSTVHLRMQRMVRDGLIESFTLKLSNEKCEEGFIVFMLLNTRSDLPKSFFSNDSIKEVFGITGEYDLLIKLKFRDVNGFNDFVISLRKRPEIEKTLSMIGTINIKEVLN